MPTSAQLLKTASGPSLNPTLSIYVHLFNSKCIQFQVRITKQAFPRRLIKCPNIEYAFKGEQSLTCRCYTLYMILKARPERDQLEKFLVYSMLTQLWANIFIQLPFYEMIHIFSMVCDRP